MDEGFLGSFLVICCAMPRYVVSRIIGKLQRDWHLCETNCVDLYVGYLVTLGCLPNKDRRGILCHRCQRWLAKFVLTFTLFFAIIMSPISVYKFSHLATHKILESILGFYLWVFMAIDIGCLLVQERRFQDMIKALDEIQTHLKQLNVLIPTTEDAEMKRFSKFTYCYFAVICYVVIPVLVMLFVFYAYGKRKLTMLSVWFPSIFYATPYFDLTLAVVIITVVYGFVVIIIMHSLLMALLVHAIGHLKIVQHGLRHAGQSIETDKRIDENTTLAAFTLGKTKARRANGVRTHGLMVPLTKWRHLGRQRPGEQKASTKLAMTRRQTMDFENRMKACICHHQAINRFVERVSAAFNLVILHQFNCSVFPVILGVVIVTGGGDIPILLFTLTAMLICWTNQALLSWLADNVTEQSALVGKAVYDCDWFDQSESFKRSMGIIILRSNQPLTIRVAGFIPLNMDTFFEILKLTYSYYMSLAAALEVRAKVQALH